MKRLVSAALGAGLCVLAACTAVSAQADVFNGRIAFSSFRTDPAGAVGDIFTINPDGTDLRRLTDNPLDDAQSDWSPDGRDIAYRIRKPETPTRNFEVARMTASGSEQRRLTFTPEGQASSQPSWFPDKSAILFRWSAPRVSNIWQMGPLGENPALRYDPTPAHEWYPSLSPDMRKVVFASTTSPTADTDRAIQTVNVDGTGLTTLFDVVGAFDSAPAWSPDGTRIAFESNANINGGNPEGDEEIWVMNADGSDPTQLTSNTVHDEGSAWSPDGTMLAYSSGLRDNDRVDIHVMTAAGVHLRQLTDYPGRDESPDWQPIPAPETDRRCGDLATTGPGVHDVRTAGLSCRQARKLAARWAATARPCAASRFSADVVDYGGTLRVVLERHGDHDDDQEADNESGAHQRGDGRRDKLVAFLYQPPARAVSFATASNVPTGDGSIALTVGDFNHDRNQDLAVANLNGADVTALSGTGTGGFGAATRLTVGGEPHSVAAGDFNDDGRKDLIVANAADDNVSLLLGKRGGRFRPATNFATGDRPAWVAIGDFNEDDHQDLAVSDFNSNDVSVLLGTGRGRFAASVPFPTGAAPRAVVVGDFNDDDVEDLAVANQSSNDVSLLVGTGTGSFRSAGSLPVGAAPSAIAVDDLNKDCNDDLVTANLGSRNASVLVGTGTGSFEPALNVPAGAGPRSVAISDLNKDANNDLIVANNDDGTVSILLGTGTGSFDAAATFPVGLGPRSIAVADLNKDGKQDLAVANRDSDNVSVLLNTTM